MRVLAFDSGAKRAGWAALSNDTGKIVYIDSGIRELPRSSKETYQDYALSLTGYWCAATQELINTYKTEYVITEIVPVRGMNDFAQGYLAHTMSVAVKATASYMGAIISQVSATKVQNEIGIKGRAKKMTKPNVRNGVISILPKLEGILRADGKVFERSDAIAIGLWYLRNI